MHMKDAADILLGSHPGLVVALNWNTMSGSDYRTIPERTGPDQIGGGKYKTWTPGPWTPSVDLSIMMLLLEKYTVT